MFVYHTHSGFRYLAILFGLATVVMALYGVATKQPYVNRMRVTAGLFAVILQVNILVGVALLFTGTGFYPALGIHVILMLGAAVVAQVVPSIMRRRPMEERTYMPHAVGALAALALMIFGILSIPGAQIFGSRL